MQELTIAPVTQTDVAMLDSALRQLAAELGDVYRADQPTLGAAICGPGAGCLALLAHRDGRPVGAVLAAPVFSTMRGGTGLFVSDLWVAHDSRGEGLAPRLLSASLQEGARRGWAQFLKLSVYHDNIKARAVYDRLGFTAADGETTMILTGAQLDTLKERP